MKKFLFFLSFVSVSNHLFSDTHFKEELHIMILSSMWQTIFEKTPALETPTNLGFLKHLAEQYLKISENQEINAQNIYDYFPSSDGATFGLDNEQTSHIIKAFVDILERWKLQFKGVLRRVFVEHAASDELKEVVEPLNIDVIKLFETESFENVVQFLIQEEDKAFVKTLIIFCNVFLKIADRPVLSRNAMIVGIGALSIGLLVAISFGITGIGRSMLSHIQNQTEAMQNQKLQAFYDLGCSISHKFNISLVDALELIQEVRNQQ